MQRPREQMSIPRTVATWLSIAGAFLMMAAPWWLTVLAYGLALTIILCEWWTKRHD